MTGLPQLTDRNPDVIRLAENDRAVMLDRIATEITATAGDQPAELVAELISMYREVALRHTDAGWWLNNSSRHLGRIIAREMTDEDRARLAQLGSRRR
ncbi:hypothetical protein [Micromonospora sp. NPDC047730]|uniref:hypothetical protein n=1 Tax=Micromonospora sp. NPDC047730 TaxID=3364253 RepID=UPI00371EABA6